MLCLFYLIDMLLLIDLYDTGNHRLLIQRLYNTTQHNKLCRVIQNLLSNRKLYMELNNERSRWRKLNNYLQLYSVLAPTLFNIYTNDQLIHDGTRNFINEDDLCITSQNQSFKQVEETIDEALDNLTTYYKMNSLRANAEKNTQVTAFHLMNKKVNRSLKLVWNETELDNTAYPKYLGVTLDRSLS